MITPSVPPEINHNSDITVIQGSSTYDASRFDYIIKGCIETQHDSPTWKNPITLSPVSIISEYFNSNRPMKNIDENVIYQTVSLLKKPVHGEVYIVDYIKNDDKDGQSLIYRTLTSSPIVISSKENKTNFVKNIWDKYAYTPDKNYIGTDNIEFSVKNKNEKFKVIMHVLVEDVVEQSDVPSPCFSPKLVLTRK